MTTASAAGADFISETELGTRGMKKVPAWVRDETFSQAKRSDADRKKAERKKRLLEKNEKPVTVTTTNDERVISTLKAVAESLKTPSYLAVISAVVDDPWLRWLLNAVSIAGFRNISDLSVEDAEKRWRDLRSAIGVAINQDGIVELVNEIASDVDRIDLAHIVVKAGSGPRAAIAAIVANDPWLARLIVEIAKSKHQGARLEQAVTLAAREPDRVVALTSALRAGGFRSWIVKRLVGA
jgi:hypothetical protein